MTRYLPLTAMMLALPAAAQVAFQDTVALDVAVAAFTGHAIGEEGGARAAVDRRLKLAACALPELDWRAANQDAVVIRCDAPRWRIFVPIRMAASAPRAAVAAAAMPVTVAPAKAEPVIRRGDPVVVEAGSASFSITRDGIAQGDAAAGARFLVKVDPAKPPIHAIAVANGRATLPGWGR